MLVLLDSRKNKCVHELPLDGYVCIHEEIQNNSQEGWTRVISTASYAALQEEAEEARRTLRTRLV